MSDADAVVDEPARMREAERELECLIRLGTVAGRVAHEINNPLASIQNAFLLVKDAIPPSHPHYPYVAAIQREIQRIASVTRMLAESYRPESDRAVGVPVSAIVTDAVRIVAQTSSVRMQLDNQVHTPFDAPAGLLRHALTQALTVAAKSAHGAETILVVVVADDGAVCVRVRYREAAPAIEPAPMDYPYRLVAAMGGTLTLTQPTPDTKELVMQLPLIHQVPAFQ